MNATLSFPSQDEAHAQMPTIRMATDLREFMHKNGFDMKRQAGDLLVLRVPTHESETPVMERPRTRIALLFANFCQTRAM